MLGLIIFGTRGVTYGSGEGEFFCPDCGDKRPYAQKRVRRFFTLYFIPLIPLDLLGEYVECRHCTSTYKTGILDLVPGKSEAEEEAEFRKATRRVLVLMMLADGKVEESEIAAIQDILGKLEKRDVPREEIDAELRAAHHGPQDLQEYCKSMAGYLNDHGREMVVRAALAVATADGHFDTTEKEALARIAGALNLSKAHFTGILAEHQGSAAA
jgi:tellurite resistance protein